jgi:hypothetical protein
MSSSASTPPEPRARARGRLALLVLGLAWLGASLAGPAASEVRAQDGDIVREFRRYFRKFKDTPTRVEAVLSLSGTELGDVVDVLMPVLADPEPELVRASVRVLAGFQTRPPVEHLLLQLEGSSGAVRAGLLQAVAEARYAGAYEAILPALADKDWAVRRRAIQALAATRDPQAPAAIAPLADDSEVAVRCAALDGLAELGSELVLPLARRDLAHSSWQVRTSAIHALGAVRHKDSIGPLIQRMAVEEGRLIQDIGEALANVTGRDFGQRLDGWQRFWETYHERFEIPTDEELVRLRAKQQERKEAYEGPPGAVTYHGIETPSRAILFVIDVSGSMEQEVVEKERFQEGDYPSYHRIDIVKTELLRTIQGLESYVRFNILAFATDVKTFKKGLVSANPLYKSSAESWIKRLEAIGGASKEDLASVGLAGSANLEAGKTNSHGALMAALEVAGRGAQDKNYEVAVDTIFFLSDGRPSYGDYVDTNDILREVQAANDLRKVVIHTIAIGEFERSFMERLAQENGGVYVDLGK